MPLKTTGTLNSEKALSIFEWFEVDALLPKHAVVTTMAGINSGNTSITMMLSGGFSPNVVGFTTPPTTRIPWTQSLRIWFTGLFRKKPEVSIQEVFHRIKINPEELTGWDERDKALQEMIQRAKDASQYTLVKRLEAEIGIRQFENALYVKGRRKYVSEEQLLKFVAKCERGLCLDWVRHFVRPIPPDVVAEKIRCDEDHLFDNYVVLHYDPDDKATTREDREEQAARRKDPILFGVIKGSRKLYFVGDWIDDHCDLTFDEIIKTLGSPLEIPGNPETHMMGQ